MDKHELAQIVYRYCRALDRLDSGLLRSVFHADAEIDMGAIYQGGVDGFVDVAMGFMGSMQSTRHCVSNILINGSVVESYVDAWHLLAGGRELIVRARYLQRAEVRDGQLAFSYHSEVVDFGAEREVDIGWFGGEIGLRKGSRDRDDPSYALTA